MLPCSSLWTYISRGTGVSWYSRYAAQIGQWLPPLGGLVG